MSKHSAKGRQWEKLRANVFRVYGRACVYCGNYANSVDHIDPVSLGGEQLPPIHKLRPACTSCNSIRGNKVRKRCNYVNTNYLKAL